MLVKIYKKKFLHDPDDREEAYRRVEAMCGVKELSENRRFAWPKYPVFNDNREFVGFGMTRVPGENLEAISSLAQIQEKYPHWNRYQIARILHNLVSGLQFLHANCVLVGDLNPGNIQFCPSELKVYFIDCDSYQIKIGRRHLSCPGYVDRYTAPEILEAASPKVVRTPESEYFSAAILIFSLLMFGLHPFSRRGAESEVANLLQGTCPWVKWSLKSTPMGPWQDHWCTLPKYLQNQFKRSFAKPRYPRSRPDLASWRKVLNRYCRELQSSRYSD